MLLKNEANRTKFKFQNFKNKNRELFVLRNGVYIFEDFLIYQTF